jgi:hypothetical protein
VFPERYATEEVGSAVTTRLIRDVLGSNLYRDTTDYRGFQKYLKIVRDSISIMPWPLPSKSFPINN